MTLNDTERMHEEQKKLDAAIHQQAGLTPADTRRARAVALSIELSELANELRFFKYWSSKPPDKKAALEEAADVWHFLLSLANDQGITLVFQESGTYQRLQSVSNLYANLMESATAMVGASQEESLWHGSTELKTLWAEELENFKEDFLELISRFGICTGALEEAYFIKNQINHQRQIDRY